MKRAFTSLAGIFLALFFASPALAVGVGDTPAFSFKSTKGETVSNETLKGKMVLVDFWATWCGPCMAEAGHMVDTHNKYKDQGLQIVGISLDQNRTALDNVVREKKFDWPQSFGRDTAGKMAQEWGVNGIPNTFLIGPDGKVLWSGHPAAMDRPIEKAMKENPPKLVDAALVASAMTELEGAEGSAGSDPGAAMLAMAKIPADAHKDGGVKARAAAVQKTLEPHAQAQLAEADELLKAKKYPEGLGKLQSVAAAMTTSASGATAMAKLDELKKSPEVKAQLQAIEESAKADGELAAAKQLQSDGKDEQAYVKFKSIAKQYAKSPAGASAAEAVATYEKDPAFVKRADESAAGSKAKGMIGLAQSLASADRKESARKKYQEVIDQFPDTSYAATAKRELAAMK